MATPWQPHANAIIKISVNKNIKNAATHRNGKGLQDGIDFVTLVHLIRNLAESRYPLKCALEAIVSAGIWPNARVNSIHPEASAKCDRCGHPHEDDFHLYWGCPSNAYIEDETVAKTQELRGEAIRQYEALPCLWLRGIPPSSFTEIHPAHAPSDSLHMSNINPQSSWQSGTYSGDASGGPNANYPCIRRIGCGLAAINGMGELLHGAKCNLPGAVQAIPRGELFCVVVLAGLAERGATIDFLTDNEGPYNSYSQGPDYCLKSSNCDLYKTFCRVSNIKQLSVSIRWMPSHLLEKQN